MKPPNFMLFFIAGAFSCSFGEEGSENEDSKTPPTGSIPNGTHKSDLEFDQIERIFNSRNHQRLPENLITPDQKLIIEPRFHYPLFPDDVPPAPRPEFATHGKRRQNVYLTDHTGRYHVKLQNLQQGTSPNFQAALGSISAHILNQKSDQEYIPFPPNGDPYNYPAYRGYPRATEPPVVRAYERASNSNYDIQSADFARSDSRRLFPPSNYKPGFSNPLENFDPSGYNPEFFYDGTFHSDQKRDSHLDHNSRWYNHGGEYRWPIK